MFERSRPGVNARAVAIAAEALTHFSSVLDEFRADQDAGTLTTIRDGVNVMQTRKEAAEATIIAASRLRQALAQLELDAHEVMEKAEARYNEVAEDFFGSHAAGSV